MPYLMGLDLGTSSLKALIVDETGRTVGAGSAEYPTLHPQPDHAEQDPEAWWQATGTAARQALSALDSHAAAVAAIAVTGQMHGTLLLNQTGQTLAPAVIWPDRRSQRQVQAITELVGAERLIETTGSPLATGFQAATLRWFIERKPTLWRQVHHVLLPKDYLRWRLTGEMQTDPSDGAGTLLLDANLRNWSADLLALLDIDADLLPRVSPSAMIAGHLTAPAAAHIGLSESIPVVVGASDTAASALGTGIVNPDRLLVTISTGGQLVLPASKLRIDRRGRIHTFCSALEPAPGQAGWYQMAATLCAGMALRWLRDEVFVLTEADAYRNMTAWAELAPPGAGGLIFLPYLVGERSPHMDPNARGVFLGLSASHGRAELVRAVMEGIALSCYDAYHVLTELGAEPIRLVLAGGGARSSLWQHIFADVFDLPLQRLAVGEQSAMGAALLAGAGIGLFDPVTAAGSWATYDPPVEPNRRRHEDYLDLLQIFRGAYQKHREDFRLLREYEQ